MFRIPDFYTNSNVEGLCGDNNFDRTDEFTLQDGTALEYTGHQMGSGTIFPTQSIMFRSSEELKCANSWQIGKLNKLLNTKY